MDIPELSHLIQSAPALQILRMRNAFWVLPFLYTTYKEHMVFSLPEAKLTRLLAETLSQHEDGTEDIEEASISFGEDAESRARQYLLHWVQKRLLQDFQNNEGETQYQLSAHAERVFQWLQTLQRRQFVGTDSRFKMLFSSLEDIVEKTQDDRTRRLEELKNKKAAIEREIKALEVGGQVEVYSNAQVEERLELFTRLCYDLLSDFREVEDNFKQIHRNIVEQHIRAENNKGAIVGYAFEAYDALRNSEQGKSFYAFWDFLISRSGQEHWRRLTDDLLRQLHERDIEADEAFLQNVKMLLLKQGRSVYEANDQMAEKLSRIISEKEMTRHRRLRKQIGEIKELVFGLMDEEEVPCGITLEETLQVKMVMEKRLALEPRMVRSLVKQPSAAEERIADMERFSRLVNATYVDKKVLWQKVESTLETKKTATLKEVVSYNGLHHGVAEVVTYFSFLKEKAGRVQSLPNMTEHIPLNEAESRFIEVPYLLFSK